MDRRDRERLVPCDECKTTGHSDKVFRGFWTNPLCLCGICKGRGWLEPTAPKPVDEVK